MARFKMVNSERIQLTDGEETARDAEEAAAAARLADYITNHKYKDDRRIAYAEIGDQLDNITKVFKFLKAAGTDVGSDGDAQITMSDAVKAAHPKPQVWKFKMAITASKITSSFLIS